MRFIEGGRQVEYVWQAPVRAWHWAIALCMFVLVPTGYLIGSPLPSVPGEATDAFWFGYIRAIHFATAYLFIVLMLFRTYWAFVGNSFARELYIAPLLMFTAEFWKGFFHLVPYYMFVRPKRMNFLGHNPMALAAMFMMFILGTLLMTFTGLALYGEGTGMDSWQYRGFSSWVLPLLGGSQAVHTWHHFGMWYLVLFVIVHVYLVVREDVYLHETVISTMINGWRAPKPD